MISIHQHDILGQPVEEIWEGIAPKVLGEDIGDVIATVDQVLNGRWLVRRIGALTADQRLEAGVAFLDIQVEGLAAVLGRVDKVGDLDPVFSRVVFLEAIEIGQEEGERGQSLLPINNKAVAILVRDDYRAKEVLPIVGNGFALVTGLVGQKEAASKVLNKFPDLLALSPICNLAGSSRSGTFAPAATSPIYLRLEFCSLGILA